MKAVAIVCTRLESRRLPGKAMKKIAGVPALVHILRRLHKTGLPIVLAVPEAGPFAIPGVPEDWYDVHVGQDDSPLHRMAEVLKARPDVDYVVRVTHDDILIDSDTITALLEDTRVTGADYATSPGIVEGAGVEVIGRANLLRAAEQRKEPTEFVSYFVKSGQWFKMRTRQSIRRNYRLTLDFPEDALVLEAVMRAVGPNATLDDVVAYVDANQYLMNVNRLPELSVYTCAYNCQEHVASAVSSVQHLGGWIDVEHVFVDDHSTDSTLTQALGSKYPDCRQTFLVNDENVGLASSSNRALSECRGKYVMRLDADDMVLGHEFRVEWDAIRKKMEQGADVVYLNYKTGRSLSAAVTADPRTHHHAGGAVFDRAFLNEVRFRDGARHWDGLDLYKRLKKLGANIAYHDAPVWFYRQTPGSMSRSNRDERERLLREIER